MASLNIISSIIAILLISSAIPSLCKSHHDEKHPNPTSPPSQKELDAREKYINSLPKDLIKFVENCTEYLPIKCGEKVINAILDKGNNVDKKCCHDLVGMGYKCTKSIIKVYIGLPEVKDKIDPKVIKSNAKKVFKKCVNVDKKNKNDHSAHPPPIQP